MLMTNCYLFMGNKSAGIPLTNFRSELMAELGSTFHGLIDKI